MASMTLAEFLKTTRDDLTSGIVEDIYTVNPIYSVMPWDGYVGAGIIVNRETTVGDAQILDIGGTITAKAASAVTAATFRATTIIGDAEINNLLKAESETSDNDLAAREISSKSKAVGRIIQSAMVGTYAGANAALFNSLHSLVDSGQYVNNGAGGAVLTFDMLDNLLAKVDSKDGEVDWIMMSQREFVKYKALLRAMGGTAADWTVTLPDGRTTIGYENIPIFVNRWLSNTETDNGAALTGGALSSIYAGNWDDGTRKIGCSMIHPVNVEMGIVVEPIGHKETTDEIIYRVKSYSNFATFNKRGVARLTGVKVA